MIIGSVLLFFALLLCVTVGFTNRTTATAASIASVQTLTGTESTRHDTFLSDYDPISGHTPYNESANVNTGIRFYTATDNGQKSNTNSIKLNSNSVYVDFTSAQTLYRPSAAHLYMETSYRFSITNKNTGKSVWSASMSGRIEYDMYDGSEVYYKQVNLNGSQQDSHSADYSILHFLPSEFGTQRLYLDNGTYTVSISRSYEWTDYDFYCGNSMWFATSTFSGTLTIDTTPLSVTMLGQTSSNTVNNGAYTKERVTTSVTGTNFERLYYKTPTSSSYTYTTSKTYTSAATNGWYYVYATDSFGAVTPTQSFYYDSAAPAGTIRSNGSTVNSGAYIGNSFSYTATDSGSGIDRLYYKTPVSGTYMLYNSGTVIPANSGDGWYYFYAIDNAGNQSVITSVYLETQPPYVEIYRNDKLAYSKTITSSGTFDTDIYINPNDRLRISCETVSGKVTSNYTLDTNITIGSSYSGSNYTITLTSATGITGNFTYHIVRNKPTITIDGKTYPSGSTLHFNTDKTVRFNDDSVITDSGDTGATVISEDNNNLNEHITYTSGNGKTLTATSGTETKYVLTLNDRAGNESRFTVFIDKLAPDGVWKTDGKVLQNGGYTNKTLSFFISEAGVTATYSHDGGEYSAYTSGNTLTADGTYHVVLTDLAGNKSTFTAYIDTVAPIGQMYANNKPVASGTITNKNVFFSWDGNIYATVNGTPYTKNSILSEDGFYKFVLTDFAGNKSTYTVTIDTDVPAYNADKLNGSQQLISKWYVAAIDGSDYSFATYDEALTFACDKEFDKSVTVLVLDDVTHFNQHHLIADGGEVRTGEYWLYKSKANANSLLYYFDCDLLNEVIAHYAKENVSSVNYFALDEDNVYGEPANSMTDNVFTAPDGTQAPVLNGVVFDKVDGTELYAELVGGNGTRIKLNYGVAFDKQLSVGGLYKLTEVDEAGNETVFFGIFDTVAPTLKVTATIYGNDSANELNITKESLTSIAAYYYRSFEVGAIEDADKWSVLTVVNSNKKICYTYGDELPVLNVGGEYLLTVYDRLGNDYSFTVYIIGNPATIDFKNNTDDTEFNLTITLEQKFDTLVSLEICKGGEPLSGVSTDTLSYSFDRAGTYTVTLRDNFGRMITKDYVFNKALPSGTLSGAVNGGKTKTDVVFSFDNTKFYATVIKDGQDYATNYNGEIYFFAADKGSGFYTVRLIRLTDAENYTDYTFLMNTLAPEFDLTVSDGTTTNKSVIVTWTASDIESVVYSLNGDEPIALENSGILSTEGVYTVIATNDLGTQSVKTFAIDKTVEYRIEVGAEPARNVEVTNESITVFSDEILTISVMKNGEPYDYMFGDILSEEGFYTFRIADEYGNSATFSVTIDKSVSYSANIGNGLIASESVQFVNGEKLTVTVTKDNQIIDYVFGQLLDEEGSYKVLMQDVYGNEKSLEFRIVKGVKRTLDYTLGESVSVLAIDRNGEAVTPDGNRLNFTDSGLYTVTAEVDGKAYSFVLELDSTTPTLELIGVSNGGVSGKSVTLDNLSEQAAVEVYKDGELIEYELGNDLKEYGEYRIIVTDKAGNQTEYTFTLKHILNGGAVALIVIGIIVLVGGVAAVLIMRKKGIFGKIKALKTDSEKPKKD